MKNVLILILLLVIGYMADRLVRTENQHYALLLNSCPEKRTDPSLQLLDFGCLETVQTRTGWLWHLYYGLTDPLPAVPFSSP